MDDILIEITYDGKHFTYDSGAKAYIFHTGIFNEIHKKFGYDALKEFVDLVFDCYIEDDNYTPLGTLADYISVRFKCIRKLNAKNILRYFYKHLDK